jgi:aryl-alcohol dehydrogenase-like predicted oxidoreductase
MKRRTLIRSLPPVSEIGLGCMSFAGFYGPSSEAQAHGTLAHALDLGVDFLDTANVYGLGLSERIIGSFLKRDHSKFTIATKAGIWRDKEHGNRGFNNKADYLRSELEGSLRRLGLEQVDLFYIHRRDHEVEIEEVMETLLTFKKEGKIAGIGFSEIAPATLRRAAAVGTVDAVQSEYSLWTRQPELGLLDACRALDVAVVPYAPLGRGILANRPLDPARFGETDFRRNNPRFIEPNFSHNMGYITSFNTFAAEVGTTPAVLALAWCLARAERIIPIPGTRTAEHLAQCAQASGFAMTPQIMAALADLLPRGWAHGDRYSQAQWNGPEGYC